MKKKKDFQLGPEERKLLEQAQSKTGKPWRELLREMLSNILGTHRELPERAWVEAQDKSLSDIWDNSSDAVYDEL